MPSLFLSPSLSDHGLIQSGCLLSKISMRHQVNPAALGSQSRDQQMETEGSSIKSPANLLSG